MANRNTLDGKPLQIIQEYISRAWDRTQSDALEDATEIMLSLATSGYGIRPAPEAAPPAQAPAPGREDAG